MRSAWAALEKSSVLAAVRGQESLALRAKYFLLKRKLFLVWKENTHCFCLLLNVYCLVWLLELELGSETVNRVILALGWSAVVQIIGLIHCCSVLAGAPVTTTTAAVVSQSPQLYNQQTNSPDSPVIVALLAFGARASFGGTSALTVASAHSLKWVWYSRAVRCHGWS